MNKCFIIGKVLNEPEFDFLYMDSKISISYFWIQLNNSNNIVKIFGYDENADYIYRCVKKGETLIIDGQIRCENKNIEIEANRIEKMVNKQNNDKGVYN